MSKKLINRFSSSLLVLMLIFAVGVFMGCEGDTGPRGPAGSAGAAGPVTHTDESCGVCHGEDRGADIAVFHPEPLPLAVVHDIVVTSGAGATDYVDFMVSEADENGDPADGIAGLTIDDVRFYIADIVPEGVTTLNAPVDTWETPYLERWLYERAPSSTTVYPVGILTDNGGGSYTYDFDADLENGDPIAPEFDPGDHQRLLIRADTRDLGFDRTIGLLDFVIPADGDSSTEVGVTREIVVMEACTACHNNPLQRAAHGGGYQSPQACNICHSPIGGEYGDDMQESGFWLASLIHGIHTSQVLGAWPGDPPADFSEVTYPKNVKDCGACHFVAGQDMADAWYTNPSKEVCGTCHKSAGAQAHLDSVANGACLGCHNDTVAPAILTAHAVTTLKNDPTVSITPNYFTNIAVGDENGDPVAVFETGDVILLTVTVEDENGDPISTYDDAASTFTTADVFVYGPRARAVPVLTPGSTTDPAWDPTTLPDQGRSMLVPSSDPQVMTDADGFKYQLLAIPANLADGTYMVQARVYHPSSRVAGARDYNIDGWALTTFQVGTSDVEPMVAGDCTQNCHVANDWGSMYHRSYFGTDGCLGCHDQSGNHANPIANRVHAVHSASVTGDLLDADWSEITFPQNADSCGACHTSGNDSFINGEPSAWGVPCIGCHGDADGARDHMLQNGAPFTAH